MNYEFVLHPQLQQNTYLLGKLELCHVLLMNDCQFPWVILVPERANVREIYELNTADQILLIQESSYVTEKLAKAFHADKMNVAAIGNVVDQLHLHHIVRHQADKAWPHAIWGKFTVVPYTQDQFKKVEERLIAALF